MEFLRRSSLVHNKNFNDDSIIVKANGEVEFNPRNGIVRINGDLIASGDVAGPTVTNVLYVTQDGDDNNTGNGESSSQAKRTLKAALAIAQQGTTIYVRSGEYYEDNPLVVPPNVSIIGDNLRTTVIRPLNGPVQKNIIFVSRQDNIVTITTSTAHGYVENDRVRIRCSNTSFDTEIGNIISVTSTTFTYRQLGANVSTTAATGYAWKGVDLFHVNSACYLNGMVFKGLRAPGYCVNIDFNAIVDTSPYVQNCSNINGPWMRNGTEWIPFQTEQPDINGNMVTGPRPLLDSEIQLGQTSVYGIDTEGAGGGMLIDGDRYHPQSPIKSMVGDAFTQVAQGGIGFHISNFGYMQLVSCFAVFCDKAFYTTNGGYLSISNSVADFGNYAFVADGYYPIPYATGEITQNYYSSCGSVTVITEGTGYTSAPTAIIDPPTTVGGVQATATVSIDPILQKVNAISIDNPGSGYTSEPTITISGGGASLDATAQVNLAKNLTVQVNNLPGKPQVGSVVFFTGDTTAYLVTDTSASSFTLQYDEQKCRRDVGYILEAVLSDMVFGTNLRTLQAGQSYLRSYSNKVISQQKTQTIAGIEKARDEALALTSNPTAQTSITNLFQEIVDIIDIGISEYGPVSYSNPAGVSSGIINAREILIANTEFIKDEIEAWITENYPALTYNSTKCRRDIGLIIDALGHDLTYGGNLAINVVANSYLEGSVIKGEIQETLEAYVHWKNIVSSIVQNILITKSATNTNSQNTSLSAGSASAGSILENLLQIVIDVLDYGTGFVPTPDTDPSFSLGDSSLNTERLIILASTSAIQDNVINYLNDSAIPGGSATITVFPAITSVSKDSEAFFHNVSTVSTGATIFEYVGAGVTYNALPFFGGEPDPTKETYEVNNGKVFFVTTDQIGNSRIGSFFNVNALTGEVTINAENLNLSGLATIGPFKRSGIPVGVALKEVSNNAGLISSIGTQDIYTVPTQYAVSNYVENRYLNKITGGTVQGPITAQQGITGDLTGSLFKDDSSTIVDAVTGNIFGNNLDLTGTAQIDSDTTIDGNLEVNGDSIFGNFNTTFTINGSFVANLADNLPAVSGNTPAALEFKENSNGYLKIETTNSYEKITFGSLPYTEFLNTADSTLSSNGAVKFLGGVGIAKNLNVGADFSASDNVTLGTLTSDQITITGTINLNVPDNSSTAFNVVQGLDNYITTDTTNGSEKIELGDITLSGFKVIVRGLTNATDKDTGALVVEDGGLAVELDTYIGQNLTVVGTAQILDSITVDGYINGTLKGDVVADDSTVLVESSTGDFIGRNLTLSGNQIIQGTSLSTSSGAFNLLNSNATTVNFAGAATTLEIGAATGTTNINNNLDVDGDLNVDGNDLTTSVSTFNLVNTNATTVNFGGAATDLQIGSATGTTNINNNLDVDGNISTDGTSFSTSQTSFDLLANSVTSLNFGTSTNFITIGATTGSTTVRNLVIGVGGFEGDLTGSVFTDNSTQVINGQTGDIYGNNLTLLNDLLVTHGGTGVGTFTQNGILYGNSTNALQVTSASNPGSNATSSYGILTTDGSNVPTWTDVIDGGSY